MMGGEGGEVVALASVFVWCQSCNCLEISVKASQRVKTAIKGYVKDLSLRICQNIRPLFNAALVDVIRKGDACVLLEIAGQIDLVIGDLIGKGMQVTFL